MKKSTSGKARRKARPLLAAAAGATLLVLPGISSCGDANVDNILHLPDLALRSPDGNLPFPTDFSRPDDLATPDLSDRLPDGNLPFPGPDLSVPDLSNRLPDGNLPSPDLLRHD